MIRGNSMALHEIHIVQGVPDRYEEYTHIFDGSKLQIHYGAELAKWIRAGLEEGHIYTAEDRNGEAVGLMWMQMESVYAGLPYLNLLGVRQDYRGHGVGRKLLEFFIAVYEKLGYDHAFIAVNDFNPRARALYVRMGFQKMMQYPDGMDPSNSVYLLMRKSRGCRANG
ncbi:MAG TPA: GNAT family N-acetyltransferase [Oscillospiraceae bacterium]|nr:GNAT family N-acetyltransferase [Oscillospiraceae bacterium]